MLYYFKKNTEFFSWCAKQNVDNLSAHALTLTPLEQCFSHAELYIAPPPERRQKWWVKLPETPNDAQENVTQEIPPEDQKHFTPTKRMNTALSADYFSHYHSAQQSGGHFGRRAFDWQRSDVTRAESRRKSTTFLATTQQVVRRMSSSFSAFRRKSMNLVDADDVTSGQRRKTLLEIAKEEEKLKEINSELNKMTENITEKLTEDTSKKKTPI